MKSVKPTIKAMATSALAAIVLIGCGIDQGGIQAPLPPAGNTGAQTLVISGPITGFGSVIVNGLRLDTSSAQIFIDGAPASEADLFAGQVIRAVAVIDQGVTRATSIEFEENVVGPIDTIDMQTGAITVLGQSVVIDADTRFDNSLTDPLAELAINDPIVVSGLTLPDGTIQASFVRRANALESFQVTASISALDIPNLSFQLSNVTIDYSQTLILDVSGGMPALQQVVEVRGTQIVGGELVAAEIRELDFVPGLLNAAGTQLSTMEAPLTGVPATANNPLEANVIGYVAAVNLPTRIVLGGVDVFIGADTEFVGSVANDLAINQLVQVEGPIPISGRIDAERISIL